MSTDDNQCKLCGYPLNLDEFELKYKIPQLMEREHLCFDCAYWMVRKEEDDKMVQYYRINSHGRIPVITTDWRHWIVDPFHSMWISIGSFAKVRLYSTRSYMAVISQAHDGVWFIDNNNISNQGIIPKHLRNQFTPNGICLTAAEWEYFQARKTVTTAEIKKLIENNTFKL